MIPLRDLIDPAYRTMLEPDLSIWETQREVRRREARRRRNRELLVGAVVFLLLLLLLSLAGAGDMADTLAGRM